jgi:single-stranded-DNA-specific exonuclease
LISCDCEFSCYNRIDNKKERTVKNIIELSVGGRVWRAPVTDTQNSDNDLIDHILTVRGIIGTENIEKFLNPSIKEYMPDPSSLVDMDAGARVIADAVMNGKKIAIYGDYDVDGITGAAIFCKILARGWRQRCLSFANARRRGLWSEHVGRRSIGRR